jgi:ATP-dependent DNA ligase
LIDGEAIVCDQNGLAVFDLIRRHGALESAVHCAFDLLELDGRDFTPRANRETQAVARQVAQEIAFEHRPQ